MIRFKDTVDFRGMQPQVNFIITVTDQMLQSLGFEECWITSICDGAVGRKPDSLHKKGLAVDFRLPNLHSASPILTHAYIATKLKERFGPQFDVVHEKDHYHIEFDPK